jgi:hypothetical protein
MRPRDCDYCIPAFQCSVLAAMSSAQLLPFPHSKMGISHRLKWERTRGNGSDQVRLFAVPGDMFASGAVTVIW